MSDAGDSAPNSVPPERLALAYRLLTAIRFDAMRTSMQSSMPQGAASLLFAGVDQSEVRRLAAEAWAALLTDEELSQLIEFFESPTGQKYMDAQSRVVEAMKPAFAASVAESMKQLTRDMLGAGRSPR